MKGIQRLPFLCFVGTILLVGVPACRSLAARENLSENQFPIVRADSDLFEAVVREELEGGEKHNPHYVHVLRFDARPIGPTMPRAHVKAVGVRGMDPTELIRRVDSVTLAEITERRKQILVLAGADEG